MAEQGVDLVVTSGGLGPTADDLTLEVVARFAGRELALDEALEQHIADILRPLMKRWRNLDFEAVRAANRKQALVPEGATVIMPAGTAPGMVVPPTDGGPTVVILPGPPRELHRCGTRRWRPDAFRDAVGEASEYEQSMLRLFGIPESEIAETLRVAEGEIEGFADSRSPPACAAARWRWWCATSPPRRTRGRPWSGSSASRHANTLFSTDGTTVDEQVAALLDGQMVATAESCTGGLMAARLTERPGSSAYVAGGTVAYANEAKTALLGVEPGLIAAHGAVSPEVADAMA